MEPQADSGELKQSRQIKYPGGSEDTEKAKDSTSPDGVNRSNSHSNSEDEYPQGIKLAIIIISLAASVFLCALDETIITTAIPRITEDFKAINDVGWYGSAYFMTFAAFQLIFGKLFSFFSIKNVFLASIAIFEVGSLICATAPTSTAFIVGRAFAGLGSAGINAGFIIILAASLPLRRRPLFVASYSGMYGVAAVAAPLLGGAFTTSSTWRWCFYINLPIGGCAMLAMVFFFHPPRSEKRQALTTWIAWQNMLSQMDLSGTAVLIPATICLLLALYWGGSTYPWKSGPIITLLVIFGIAVPIFIAIQVWKENKATIPMRIIKQRSVACSVTYVFHAGGALNTLQYFLPIWFQAIQGVSAFNSGTRILPTTLGTVLFAFVAGIGVFKTGYYTPFMITGAALLLLGACLSTMLHVSSPATQWVIYQLIFGAGAGLGIQQAHTAAQTVLEASDVPTGAVIVIFAQILGGTVWLSVAQNILTSQLLAGLGAYLPDLNPQKVLNVGATGLRDMVEAQDLDAILSIYNSALTRVFWLAGALGSVAFVSAWGMEWKSIKKKGNKENQQDQ